MKCELPHTVKISKVIEEAEGIKSFILPIKMTVEPGQFAMLWLPGVDAKPVAISSWDEQTIGVTVSAVGPWSKEVCGLSVGDRLGVFGPYGNSFKLKGSRIILVSGGYGAATLMLLAETAFKNKFKMTMIIGARTKNLLLYQERLERNGISAIYTTDDGSFGEKGFSTDVLTKLLDSEHIDTVYACGPELMEKKVAEICVARKTPSQISLERQMKCGFGVCGACAIDPSGQRVCVEGTIFSGEELLRTKEFGKYHRDSSATKHLF